MGMTKFVDLTKEEFKKTMLSGFVKKDNTDNLRFTEGPYATSVDWNAKGAVTPIKN